MALPWQRLHFCASVLRYTYSACLVNIIPFESHSMKVAYLHGTNPIFLLAKLLLIPVKASTNRIPKHYKAFSFWVERAQILICTAIFSDFVQIFYHTTEINSQNNDSSWCIKNEERSLPMLNINFTLARCVLLSQISLLELNYVCTIISHKIKEMLLALKSV